MATGAGRRAPECCSRQVRDRYGDPGREETAPGLSVVFGVRGDTGSPPIELTRCRHRSAVPTSPEWRDTTWPERRGSGARHWPQCARRHRDRRRSVRQTWLSGPTASDRCAIGPGLRPLASVAAGPPPIHSPDVAIGIRRPCRSAGHQGQCRASRPQRHGTATGLLPERGHRCGTDSPVAGSRAWRWPSRPLRLDHRRTVRRARASALLPTSPDRRGNQAWKRGPRR